jgi:hypothetical protein
MTHTTIAVPTPEAGSTLVASSVTTAGPATKIISSTTDSSANAECSLGEPASSVLHLALTIEPSEGIDAPATQPVSSSAHTGARNSAQVMNTIVLTAKSATSGRRTRRCPTRSARVAIRGAQTAYPMEPAPETKPARPYCPVVALTSNTVPRPNMDIGSRPIAADTENLAAPGIRSKLRYAFSLVRSCPPGCSVSSAATCACVMCSWPPASRLTSGADTQEADFPSPG